MTSRATAQLLAPIGATLIACIVVLAHEHGMTADAGGCVAPMSATEFTMGALGLLCLLSAAVLFYRGRRR
ncbi:hypothetical protein HQQ80_11630 [Microbacteriaceae bacterium VKM Ac-2855]|nr:hypothetical protein [Microbacteriaceae bacterium VKM Ac-2855]